jgi:DNA-binding Xre family transcriptional regulator
MPSVNTNAVVIDYQQITLIESDKAQVCHTDLISALCQKLVTAKYPFKFFLAL